MKRLLTLAVVVALSLPVVAGAASNYTGNFQAGTYTGTVTSVIPAIDGKPATMEVKQIGNKVIATVSFEGGKEVWTWDNNKLNQQEIDLKKNTVAMTYDANAKGTPTGTKQTYYINCKDTANNVCDAGADYRNYWILDTNGNKITYTVFGVDPAKKADKSLKATKRHEFVLNKTN